MRLTKISLLAIVSVALVSGCSARRGTSLRHPSESRTTSSLQDDDNNGEYHPRVYEEDEDLREPTSPVPASPNPHSEPAPAPPAFGVSRVKSVGWLNDIGSRLHRRPSSTTSEECGDEQPFPDGACSPVDSCTPETSCGSEVRIQRYRSQVHEKSAAGRLQPLKSLQKSLGKLFHRPTTPCGSDCAESVPDDRRARRALIRLRRESSCGQDCGEDEILQGRCTPLINDQCAGGSVTLPGSGAPAVVPRRERLADPMQEPFFEDSVPSPGAHENKQAPGSVPETPTIPSLDRAVPAVPDQDENPAAVPGDSVQVIEPPIWPRRKTTSGDPSAPRAATHYTPLPAISGATNDLPQIVPGRRL